MSESQTPEAVETQAKGLSRWLRDNVAIIGLLLTVGLAAAGALVSAGQNQQRLTGVETKIQAHETSLSGINATVNYLKGRFDQVYPPKRREE